MNFLNDNPKAKVRRIEGLVSEKKQRNCPLGDTGKRIIRHRKIQETIEQKFLEPGSTPVFKQVLTHVKKHHPGTSTAIGFLATLHFLTYGGSDISEVNRARSNMIVREDGLEDLGDFCFK